MSGQAGNMTVQPHEPDVVARAVQDLGRQVRDLRAERDALRERVVAAEDRLRDAEHRESLLQQSVNLTLRRLQAEQQAAAIERALAAQEADRG